MAVGGGGKGSHGLLRETAALGLRGQSPWHHQPARGMAGMAEFSFFAENVTRVAEIDVLQGKYIYNSIYI